jgi:Ca-activated chloride channel family protein
LYKGEQVVAVGRYAGQGKGRLVLEGTINGAPQRFAYEVEFPASAAEHEFIPRLWATRRIGYLLDEIRLRGENQELREEVTELARKYGIVTPYTAYLIHEDESRRQIPLAMQSLPELQRDALARDAAKGAYQSLSGPAAGVPAVAGARYGISQKSANQVSSALQMAQAESERSINYLMRYGLVAPQVTTAAPGQAPAAVAAAPQSPELAARRVSDYSQQTRYAAGRNFFQNGNQWVDSQVQKLTSAKKVRVQFGAPEYFTLLAKEPQVRPWLALGQNVVFALKDTVYEIYE